MFMTKAIATSTLLVCVVLASGIGYATSQVGQATASDALTNAEKKPGAQKDNDLLQGTWRYVLRNPVTDAIEDEEDLMIRNRLYVRRFRPGGGGGGNETSPALIEIFPETSPKRLILHSEKPMVKLQEELNKFFTPDSKANVESRVAQQRCTFQLSGDQLTIHFGPQVKYLVDAAGKISLDVKSPDDKYPSPALELVRVYHRVTNNPNEGETRAKVVSDAEKKLLDQRIETAEEVVRLRLESYKAGKEPVDIYLESVKQRVEVKLDRVGADPVKRRALLQEALDAAVEVENIAKAKYQAGSATLLDMQTAKLGRLNLELRLLRNDQQTKK